LVHQFVDSGFKSEEDIGVIELHSPAHLPNQIANLGKLKMAIRADFAGLALEHIRAAMAAVFVQRGLLIPGTHASNAATNPIDVSLLVMTAVTRH